MCTNTEINWDGSARELNHKEDGGGRGGMSETGVNEGGATALQKVWSSFDGTFKHH